MALKILRGLLIVLVVAVTALYVLEFQQRRQTLGEEDPGFGHILIMMAVTVGVASVVIAVDVVARQKKLSALSGVFLGLMAGLLVAFVLGFVIDLVALLTAPQLPFPEPSNPDEYAMLTDDQKGMMTQRVAYLKLLEGVKVFIGLITCYLGMSLVLQTKDDFRFVIPYIEFSKQVRGHRPVLLDTSVVIDGRVVDIARTRFLTSSMIVPRFVLNELQTVADSSDKLRRARGRRGLEVLQKLQGDAQVDISIMDIEVEGTNVDQKLVVAAQELNARVMTNDYNLSKICDLRGVEVMNLNDLAKSLRPVVLPGEKMTVKIIRAGESAGQGVGYLEDGTMVVVEKASNLAGTDVELVVTSMLQTSAGRMIFGRSLDGSGGELLAKDELADSSSDESDTTESNGGRKRSGSGGRNPRRTH